MATQEPEGRPAGSASRAAHPRRVRLGRAWARRRPPRPWACDAALQAAGSSSAPSTPRGGSPPASGWPLWREAARCCDLGRFAAGAAAGSMSAMTLDTKRTFDALVERYAGDARRARRILDNRFYRQVSSALAGSHEYMAMEKLLELSARRALRPRRPRHASHAPRPRLPGGPRSPHELPGHQRPALFPEAVLRRGPPDPEGRDTHRRPGSRAWPTTTWASSSCRTSRSSSWPSKACTMASRSGRPASTRSCASDGARDSCSWRAPRRPPWTRRVYFHGRLREKGMPFVAFVVNRASRTPAQGPAARSAADGQRSRERRPGARRSACRDLFRDSSAWHGAESSAPWHA